VVFFAEVKLVDGVTGIQGAELSLHLHLHVVVEIGVATDVKIAWDLLHGE
jgi:hypothetical protein